MKKSNLLKLNDNVYEFHFYPNTINKCDRTQIFALLFEFINLSNVLNF